MSRYRRSFTPGGSYFFTATLADRHAATLTEHIDLLRSIYKRVSGKLPFETVAICVLPDHLHVIWTLPPEDSGYPQRWNLIKGGFSRGLPCADRRSASKRARREKGIWQRRYWEHRIRDEEDLRRHVDYIHHNPVKHGLARCVRDWPYSSFHDYVRRGWLTQDWAGDAGDEAGYGE